MNLFKQLTQFFWMACNDLIEKEIPQYTQPPNDTGGIMLDGYFSPVKRVFKNKHSMMMLAAALLWGVSSSFHRIGIKQTDALFWSVSEIRLISLYG